nr:type 2 isopentenyl-diphosphate Delta-isomerase [Thalassobius sp. Cn5-15]
MEHIRAIHADPEVERGASGFDRVALTHRALPELDMDAIDTHCDFLGKGLRFPLLISSMTGGAGDECLELNRNLAIAAQETGVAMAVGSQRVMFTNTEARASFDLRAFAPDVPLLANVGAVQLNKGFTLDHCRAAVEVLAADALYLHLNPLQEAVQPEGDRDFSGLAAKIADVAQHLDVPVILKEVGSGLSQTDVNLGLASGICHFDVAGRGGTSWSRIEYHRRSDDDDDLGLVFQDWGLTTVDSLIAAQEILSQCETKTTLIASGGIRNGVDMAKAVILGADLCGVAAPFLAAAQVSSDAVVSKIRKFQKEFTTAMFLLGAADVHTLQGNTSLIR